ncbi:MAG: copper resistance protein NlpE [Weeksellaceae bacterium]|nr:copper resistance protein NlpE [Weeksellaceae bacterium]
MKNIHILTLSIILTLFGCKENYKKNNQEEVKEEPIEIVDGHTSENSLDWDGTYKGFLPCASCPGILTTVKLNNDKTFEKSDFYLGTKNGYSTDKGTFSFDENGRNIVLKFNTGSSLMYAVGENRLTMLDKDGKKNMSEFAKMYELTKASNKDIEFSNRSIKGLLTFGHEVRTFEPCGSSKTYWVNDFSDGKLAKMYNEKIKNQLTPYTPLMAELVVKNLGKTQEGFAEQYDGVLEIIEIKLVEHITPENYCKK